tara:strand:- start:1812 stop:3032 length:1221 start_codon:yes stop_codon:yes gene_type:complete
MKVALLGNMNNANFALLRYLKDKDINATLLLWKNDGKLSHSHFKLQNDTWDFKYWSKFVKRTNLTNAASSIIFNPLKSKNYVSKKYFLNLHSKYDVFISSGIAPAIFEKFNKKLDIFYPYAMGVEWIDTFEEKISRYFSVKKIIFDKIKRLQIKGIQNAKFVINPELGKTEETLKKIKVQSIKLYIPIIYNENVRNYFLNEIKKIKKFNFRIISHARHLWKPSKLLTNKENEYNSKNNDWLIYSFKNFLAETKSNSCLILFKYGPDYKESYKLCKKLKIQKNVIWLPILARKKILSLIKICNLGIGEFYLQKNTFWGGTAIEILSQGKPTFQTFRFNNFKKIFKKKPPPFLKINNKFEIKQQLVKLYSNKNFRKKIGYNSKKWFKKEYEISLINDWIKVINKCFNK